MKLLHAAWALRRHPSPSVVIVVAVPVISIVRKMATNDVCIIPRIDLSQAFQNKTKQNKPDTLAPSWIPICFKLMQFNKMHNGEAGCGWLPKPSLR